MVSRTLFRKVPSAANHQREAAQRHLGVSLVGLHLPLLIQRDLTNVAHDADDADPGSMFVSSSELNGFADRLFVRPYLSRGAFADHGDRLCAKAILVGERSPAQNWNPHRAQIIRAGDVAIWRRNFPLGDEPIPDMQACAIEAAAQGKNSNQSGRLYTRQRANLCEQFAVEYRDLLISLQVWSAQVYRHRDGVLRIEAWT